MTVSVTVARVGVHIDTVTTLTVGTVTVSVTGGSVGGEIVTGEGVGGVTVTVSVELLDLAFSFAGKKHKSRKRELRLKWSFERFEVRSGR